ncbi:esterase/lipase family protein [Empedobacter brevis]|uniref:esterase/lipase family protein n=1 Tax=Empedobacter brevis TaxID=247 RepID=UPI0039B0E3B0
MITHIKNPNSDKCIVFIHGLGGGSHTFQKFSIYLDSKWNLNYGVLLRIFKYYRKMFYYEAPSWMPNMIINIFGYLTFPVKALWSKRNSYNVDLLKQYINDNCADTNNIILVAHSMGGLIARQYLVDCKKNGIDIRRIRMLCTFATPHNGSHIAKYASYIVHIPIFKNIYVFFSNIFKYRISPQIGDLSNLNDFIITLNKDWSKFNVGKDLQFVRICGTKDRLVKINSSNHNNDDLENVYYFNYGHTGLISPLITDENFEPIDKFLERLLFLEDNEEFFEELEEEIDYDGTDDNF